MSYREEKNLKKNGHQPAPRSTEALEWHLNYALQRNDLHELLFLLYGRPKYLLSAPLSTQTCGLAVNFSTVTSASGSEDPSTPPLQVVASAHER